MQKTPSQTESHRIVKNSLLDITYPYLKTSMLAQSFFYGFQCLIFLIAVHFAIIYLLTNYLQKGYILNWTVLRTIFNNLILDMQVVLTGVVLVLGQIYLSDLIGRMLKNNKYRYGIIYGYCLVWLAIFVLGGVAIINHYDFYFTDRIFIVVCSWTFPTKSGSYCIDRLHGSKAQSLLTKLKFIVSPMIVYKKFLTNHNSNMRINKLYLFIKSCTATVCLLINYILLTQVIAPYLQPSNYGRMSFPELFFRITILLFLMHICLYYLIMENIMLALAECTQLEDRIFYLDWWNAQTISEYLDKWVLLINVFSEQYLKTLSRQVKHAMHTTIIFLMLFSIFGESINLKMLLFASANIMIVFFLGDNTKIQNNYFVHMLTICFQPFCLALILKYNIFG